MRDRRAERALGLRALDVDVDPLVVAGQLGEPVDVLLGDLAPVARADGLADQGLKLLDSVHGLHCHGRASANRCDSGRGADVERQRASVDQLGQQARPRRARRGRRSSAPASGSSPSGLAVRIDRGRARPAGRRARPPAAGRRRSAPRRRARRSPASARGTRSRRPRELQTGRRCVPVTSSRLLGRPCRRRRAARRRRPRSRTSPRAARAASPVRPSSPRRGRAAAGARGGDHADAARDDVHAAARRQAAAGQAAAARRRRPGRRRALAPRGGRPVGTSAIARPGAARLRARRPRRPPDCGVVGRRRSRRCGGRRRRGCAPRRRRGGRPCCCSAPVGGRSSASARGRAGSARVDRLDQVGQRPVGVADHVARPSRRTRAGRGRRAPPRSATASRPGPEPHDDPVAAQPRGCARRGAERARAAGTSPRSSARCAARVTRGASGVGSGAVDRRAARRSPGRRRGGPPARRPPRHTNRGRRRRAAIGTPLRSIRMPMRLDARVGDPADAPKKRARVSGPSPRIGITRPPTLACGGLRSYRRPARDLEPLNAVPGAPRPARGPHPPATARRRAPARRRSRRPGSARRRLRGGGSRCRQRRRCRPPS